MSLHKRDMIRTIRTLSSMSMDLLRWAMIAAPVLMSFAVPVQAEDVALGYADAVSLEPPSAAAPAKRLLEFQQFGPFRVVAQDRVELVDAIDSDTPAAFAALLSAFPSIGQIDMIECPGSEDDDANLALARMVRKAGIATHVPATGSIRSGGVELFMAGVKRSISPGAEIGVHSWQDSDGFEATDYAANDPVHMPYISFYRDMGLSDDQARAFYAFTNSAASFDDVHYMSAAEVARFGLLTGA
jgi:hypothetical protein